MDLNLRAGTVGPVPDDIPYVPRGDNWLNMLVTENGPKYLEWNRRGLLYVAGSNTALAIPIFSTPTASPTLWNPGKSPYLVVVTEIALALAAGATIPDSGFGLLFSSVIDDMIGTNHYFTTWADGQPWNLRDLSLDGMVRYAQNPVWAAIPTQVKWLGKNQFTLGTAASAGFGDACKPFDGEITLWPGQAVSIVASVASATTFMPSITYARLPKPSVP